MAGKSVTAYPPRSGQANARTSMMLRVSLAAIVAVTLTFSSLAIERTWSFLKATGAHTPVVGDWGQQSGPQDQSGSVKHDIQSAVVAQATVVQPTAAKSTCEAGPGPPHTAGVTASQPSRCSPQTARRRPRTSKNP